MESGNIIDLKTKAFAVRIIKFAQFLQDQKREFILSKQILRSGTSIGANTRERKNAASKADFINKFAIALKEADETSYWLELLFESDFIDKKQFDSIYSDCEEIISLLVSITKTQKRGKINE